MQKFSSEVLAPVEKVTYGKLVKAIENISFFYKNPKTPIMMAARTIEIADKTLRILSGECINIYSNGYPFSGGYNLLLNGEQTPIVSEIVRFTDQQKSELEAQIKNPLKEYHCLGEGIMKEEQMLSPDGKGMDFTEQIYKCPECQPPLQKLFYPFPDLDLYILVDEYPSVEALHQIQEVGRGLGLFPKYTNLSGMLNFFARNSDPSNKPPLAIDYFFVKKEDVKNTLQAFSDGSDWVNLKIACQMIRYGTQTFRGSFLEIGKNLTLDLQPMKQTDQQLKTNLEAVLQLFLTKNTTEDLLERFSRTSKSSSKNLYSDSVIQESVGLRHKLIREQGLVDIL